MTSQTINTPDPVDVAVGQRTRAIRKLKGMSQGTLAEACGVSFQQIQKYERGANRISASMLVRIAQTLQVPVTDLFSPEMAGLGTEPEAITAAYKILGKLGGETFLIQLSQLPNWVLKMQMESTHHLANNLLED